MRARELLAAVPHDLLCPAKSSTGYCRCHQYRALAAIKRALSEPALHGAGKVDAVAWNAALETAAQIVERYNAVFADPECGGAPSDIRALKRVPRAVLQSRPSGVREKGN